MTANNPLSTKAKSSLEIVCFSIIARREPSQKNSSRHSEDFQFRHEKPIFAIYRKREASEDSKQKKKEKEKEEKKIEQQDKIGIENYERHTIVTTLVIQRFPAPLWYIFEYCRDLWV